MKTIHTKQNKVKKETKSKSRLTGKKLFFSSIVAIIIAISPYIFYLYEGFPESPTWETSFFTLRSNYYEDVSTAMWVYLGKIVPLILLTLWFFTCRDWWYHVILIPIAMYIFQLISAVIEDTLVDTKAIYYILPVMMIIVPIVYLIRLKLFDKYVYNIDLQKIDAELAEYERKEKEMLEENK
ncbi:hypothetical protein U8527_11900 [Kordia algicida OT-1]|uniref:Uncharacterized protein n=1 Tax=Kordia algicida OT-1 TaxID=391587 RepID=A9E0B2_9FLAO|nr:hypothetical protein KAOT1_05437 [Kordia algicida OT-1]